MKTSSCSGVPCAKVRISATDSSRDDAGDAQLPGELRALGARDGHLRGGVDLHRRRQRAGQQRHRGVLHDDGVDAGGGAGSQEPLEHRQLVLEDDGVQRDVGAGPGAVHLVDDGGQRLRREVGGPRARVEALVEAEVDGVGLGRQRGREAVGVTGGGEDLWQAARG
jgi:hypothetical protein